MVNNELFGIGGSQSCLISKLNAKKSRLEHMSNIYNEMMLQGCELLYHTNSNSIFIVGGFDHTEILFSGQILQYNLSSKEYTKLSISLSRAMTDVCCFQVINCQYIIISRGWKSGSYYDDIYVYCIKTQTINFCRNCGK